MVLNIHSREEMTEQLLQQYQLLTDWFDQLPAARFDRQPAPGKWSAGQHADHLLKSTRPLNKALKMPRIMLKSMFGTNNRQERTFEELIEKYKRGLAAGGQATGDFVPPPVSNDQKAAMTEELRAEVKKLVKTIGKWKEADMSVYILPHPLIGKLTLREMMFFTIYHTHHHYQILKDRY